MVRSTRFILVLLAALGGCDSGPAPDDACDRAKLEFTEQARAKGRTMYAEVIKLAESRKTLAQAITAGQSTLLTDPTPTVAKLTALMTEQFTDRPDLDALFGWQLAGIGADGIHKTFQLYEEANGLRIDLGYLVGFLNANLATLSGPGGPRQFAVLFARNGAQLVERGDSLCGASPCSGEGARPTHHRIRSNASAEFTTVAAGTKDGQAIALDPDGETYAVAIGLNPEFNTRNTAVMLLARVQERLSAMEKAEGRALEALATYAENPNIGGAVPIDVKPAQPEVSRDPRN
jgi:hypothetical protein